jgi:hypothetical protein
MDDLILSLHLVGRLGQQLAGGFLAENELLAIGGGELVGRVRLTETELVNVRWEQELRVSRRTCFTSNGVLISGTFWSMNRSREGMSMGWRTAPAIIAV